jgi:glucokinase
MDRNLMETVLGIDLGGTEFKAGVVTDAGEVIAEARVPSTEKEGASAWVATAIAAARKVLGSTDVVPGALGLSIPGAVDPENAVLVDLVARMPDGAGLKLKSVFSELGLPVSADNDARAALAAERRWGAAVGRNDVVLITVGTGLGGAALVGGVAPGGDPVLAGNQLGHLTIELDGAKCVCGNTGCAETVASSVGIARMAAEAGLVDADPRRLFAMEAIDDRAASVIAKFLEGLGATVVNAIHAYQPELVLLGGGIMGSADRILPTVRSYVVERVWTVGGRQVAIERSAMGEDLGILAAAAVAFNSFG